LGVHGQQRIRPQRRANISEDNMSSARQILVTEITDTAGRSGGRLLLQGEPGLGKSTLFEQAISAAQNNGVRVLRARASEVDGRLPHQSLVDLFDSITDDELAFLAAPQRRSLHVALSRRIPDGIVLPLTLSVAVSNLLARLLEDGPVAIAIDEWGWMDQETKDILHYTLARPDGERLLAVIATARSDELFSAPSPRSPERGLFSPEDIRDIPRFDEDELGLLLRSRFRENIDDDTVSSACRLSGGNPLWALELVRARLTGGPSGSHDLPDSVADLVLARVGALEPLVADVLASVSALGDSTVQQVLTVAKGGEKALDEALTAGVVQEVGDRVRVSHPLLGRASMASQSREDHMRVHQRAATVATSQIERAHHLDLSLWPGPDEGAAMALAAASDEARTRGAIPSAHDLARRALDRTSPQSPELQMRILALAETAFAQGRYALARDTLSALQKMPLTVPIIDRALPLMLDAVSAEEGDDFVIARLDEIEPTFAGQPLHQAILAGYRAEVESYPMSARLVFAEQAMRALSTTGEAPISMHRTLGALVLAKLDAGEGLDRALLDQSEEIENDVRLVTLNDSARAQTGFYAYQVDDHDLSREALNELLEQAKSLGEVVLAGLFAVHLASVEIETGNLDVARTLIEQFDAINPWTDSPPPSIIRSKGLMAITEGDQGALNDLIALPQGPGTAVVGRRVRLSLQGIMAARQEKWADALPFLREAAALYDSAGVFEPGRRLWVDVELAESLIALDRAPEADAMLKRITLVAARGNRPLARARELRIRGMIQAARQELPEAEKTIRSALDYAQGPNRTAERARILFELARLLRRRRARARSREHFERAKALAEAAGDALLTGRINRELGRFTVASSSNALTPGEARVAEAVRSGAGNSEIAASQFISTRTVEAHLSAIYRKFGVHSRNQLMNVLTNPTEA
jgi:DNA-binding NarL/FixJ family response regulator/nucleoside-triphosphatase THEP1